MKNKFFTQQADWKELIQKLERSKRTLIEFMVTLREENSQMERLKSQYQNSQLIPTRIEEANYYLAECQKMLASIQDCIARSQQVQRITEAFLEIDDQQHTNSNNFTF